MKIEVSEINDGSWRMRGAQRVLRREDRFGVRGMLPVGGWLVATQRIHLGAGTVPNARTFPT